MKIGIVGMGIMGSGIAQLSATSGHEVVATDVSKAFYDRGMVSIGKSLDKLIEKKLVNQDKGKILARIVYTDDVRAFAGCEIVIEAVVENYKDKVEFFRKIEPIVAPNAIIASNTSSISITSLGASLKDPSRFLGIHFFNPVALMNLIELVKGVKTSNEAVGRATEFAKSVGKEYVVVNDSPGFVTTRVIALLVNEGAFEYSEGLASREDIDKALKLGGNFPMGPLTLGDLIGLDTVVNIMDVMYDSFKDPKFRAAPILRKMVEAGKLGRKSGEGFYKY
ncbi:MAG: 3-hydroxyacyl-CoA dehydrogenase NAD-binding domain-containing protein [Thermoplasmatales archaeon]|nr:3-hydroxyacyl-CoA dehydrogenase NAD-binding domain-containing protein [Candidatus Thermoplasmatota archaeon]MCL6002732.1 3-hydroxyacyl-CoA dehydrogenase NAD-binding domain-containing protein [Candidatus Thermoplasmatota archaeon]MDA8054723.1 3-hydroxyacyl-CoA dehydrogenase NAD-binding domain-containing protein [Thermoplasmatales archaeon]